MLAEALAALQSRDKLVVWRLGCSFGHLIDGRHDAAQTGVFLRSLTEGFDTSTASARLLFYILGAGAEFERELIEERSVAGMKPPRSGARRPSPGVRGFAVRRS